jgi:uncharacterized protein involved in type VI secretion and phage assembly
MGNLFDSLVSEDQQEARVNRVNGVATGIITKNDDPEGLGRVKVHFPWLSDQNETDWVRICSLMTGTDMGAIFLPEVDDEVLVAFEKGDINRPFVLGSLWNSEVKPKENNSNGKNNIRQITSRSGHQIIFDDTENKENLVIHSKSGHKIILNDEEQSEKITIKDKSENNSIEIDSSQNSITITSQQNMTIKATNIKIEATGTMSLKSQGTMSINGSLVKIN